MLLSQRDRLPVSGLPFAGLISGYQQDRVTPGIGDSIDDAAGGVERPRVKVRDIGHGSCPGQESL
jgi:hypothetical protein